MRHPYGTTEVQFRIQEYPWVQKYLKLKVKLSLDEKSRYDLFRFHFHVSSPDVVF